MGGGFTEGGGGFTYPLSSAVDGGEGGASAEPLAWATFVVFGGTVYPAEPITIAWELAGCTAVLAGDYTGYQVTLTVTAPPAGTPTNTVAVIEYRLVGEMKVQLVASQTGGDPWSVVLTPWDITVPASPTPLLDGEFKVSLYASTAPVTVFAGGELRAV